MSGIVFGPCCFRLLRLYTNFGGVYVFYVYFDVYIVYGVGVCIDVCSVGPKQHSMQTSAQIMSLSPYPPQKWGQIPVHSLFRHGHVVHGLSYPFS